MINTNLIIFMAHATCALTIITKHTIITSVFVQNLFLEYLYVLCLKPKSFQLVVFVLHDNVYDVFVIIYS